MRRRIDLRAFAKINLTLDVLGKRADGYHEMLMVMQAVSLYDDISISVGNGSGITVTTDVTELPVGTDNLAGLAAREFLRANGIENVSVSIHIKKRIPDRAGLAGGSSDAAAVLRGLNELLGTGLDNTALQRISKSVGSDVAFCVSGGTALAEGRGDMLTELAPMPDSYILICKPDFSVSTPELFGMLDGIEISSRPDTSGMLRAIGTGDLADTASKCMNVFEEALPEPERAVVAEIKAAMLSRGALGASMTGTGSAVYGIFKTRGEAENALTAEFRKCFIAEPVKKVL